MRTKKAREARVPPDMRHVNTSVNLPQKVSSSKQMDFPNLSSIDRDSFLEELQQSNGNPLHSTAVEDDLRVLEKGQVNQKSAGRKNTPQTQKAEQRGAAVKRKEEEDKNKRSTGERAKARPLKNMQMKNKKKRTSESDSGTSSDAQSQEESDSVPAQRKRKKVLPSDEDDVVEDRSWHPSPKKTKVYSLGRIRKSLSARSKSRKSSSGSTSAGPEKANSDKRSRKRHAHQGGTDLEVVLDALLDFCDQYKESVQSQAVKQSIDSFSNHVKVQLVEKISSYKELRVLKKENAKVGSLIHRKRQKLLGAKHELMRAERQVCLLQKEEADLKLRLADLKQGYTFLHNIRELNRQYLDYRDKYPKEKEMYGVSSLPALLLETKHFQTAEHQLRGINDRLEKGLKRKGTRV
ncbi:centromere protein U isoform X2 [Mastacembelus armatus]|uniref:Centromere protein U n=1 Tax=Mastacembelus armatus TaxID=205130 RepID=A0A3Q3MA12_9TELE|nr:centromere protein U isoform X2 [Mastacembelus armatus]